jgi:uncharacterized protein (DUF2235 family)
MLNAGLTPRTLVLCFDGTSDQYNSAVSCIQELSLFRASLDMQSISVEYKRRQILFVAEER